MAEPTYRPARQNQRDVAPAPSPSASLTITTTFLLREMQVRHFVVGSLGLLLAYGFWLSRPQWVPEMRLWRAIGDASLILLYITLGMGPLAKFLPRFARLIPYRRELGIWFGLLALLHTLLILNGWARWDVKRFLGYEFIPQVDRFVRLESGFGLANLLGLTAMLITLPLMVTSADWAVRTLGGNGWKFLHYGAYIIFWLVLLHTIYFLFIHYTEHFHRRPPPDPNWFGWPFVGLTIMVAILQAGAFFRTVRRQTRSRNAPLVRRGVLNNERSRNSKKAP